MGIAAVRSRLVRVSGLRDTVQALRTAGTIAEPWRFLRDQVSPAPSASYTAKRTGHLVTLRPRQDLQVARELLSKDAYVPPVAVEAVLRRRRPRIVDLGANIGLYALSEVSRFGSACRVIAVEPDRENLALLAENVAQNQMQDQIEIEDAAVGVENGTVLFHEGQDKLSHVLRPSDEQGGAVEVRARDAFQLMDGADLVKIDIEGSEWPILRDPRLRDLSAIAIALEWHDHLSESDNPRSLAQELLEDAGFRVVVDEAEAPHVGFIWGVRTNVTASP